MTIGNDQSESNDLRNHGNNQSAESIALLCKSQCGFYGSSAYFGFCSRCFKIFKENQANVEHSGQTIDQESVQTPQGYPCMVYSSLNENNLTSGINSNLLDFDKNQDQRIGIPNGKDSLISEHLEEGAVQVATPCPLRIEANKSKQLDDDFLPQTQQNSLHDSPINKDDDEVKQENDGKCFTCRRKIGHLVIKCKCGHYFCRVHRAINKHDCQFDFKAQQKKIIEETSPFFKSKSNIEDI